MQDWLNNEIKKSRVMIPSNPRRYYGGINIILGKKYTIK